MKKLTLGIITLLISACSLKKNTYLVKFHEEEFDEIGVPSGYLNSNGDTIIPIGKYYYCYTDTIWKFGMVIEKGTMKILGIDQHANELFEVFKYDNGPDYLKGGLFRIIKNDKMGYANSSGKIIIEPKFDCARPFDGDFAEVSDNYVTVKTFEHFRWSSDNWYQITKDGKRVEK